MSSAELLLRRAAELRKDVGGVHESLTKDVYETASKIAGACVSGTDSRNRLEMRLDRILTSKLWGFPIMLALLAGVFWVTIEGANVPSQMLASGLFWIEDQLAYAFQAVSAPAWLEGLLVHGVYRSLAWVVSVMLPPMAAGRCSSR